MAGKLVSTYLVFGLSIRYHCSTDPHPMQVNIPNRDAMKGRHTSGSVRTRAIKAFQLLPQIAECIVLINGNLSTASLVKVVVDEAQNYAKKVVVISISVAKAAYALRQVDETRVQIGNRLMIIFLIQDIVEFMVLERGSKKFHAILRLFADVEDAKRIYLAERPEHVAVLFAAGDERRVGQIVDQIPNPQLIDFKRYIPNPQLIDFKRYVFLLNNGGLDKAWGEVGEYGNWDIANFSSGLDAVPYKREQKPQQLVHFGAEFPFSVKPISIKFGHYIHYAPETVDSYEKVSLENRPVHDRCFLPEDVNKTVVCFDENGIPFTDINEQPSNSKSFYSAEDCRTKIQQLNLDSPPEDPSPSSFSETLEISSSTKNEVLKDKVEIILNSNGKCAVSVTKNGKNDEEWIPMYVSFKTGVAAVGFSAIEDFKTDPEFVIFDILELFGKKYSEIKMNPKWRFKLERDNNDDFIISFRTPARRRECNTETILAVILLALKDLAKSKLGEDDVSVRTNFKMTENQKSTLKAACEKAGVIFPEFN
uniref:Uncharacterized protein n=1 Tax=Panagrolaimus sp. JU765 TaxID=591449 RepID=A0AC34QLX3_9BILA